MITILAADTSTSINTIALCHGAAESASDLAILAETVVACKRLHSERLIATLDWVLGEAGVSLDEVDVLAVSNGPGSFTGLRVGMATWKGLAFGRGIPLVAVPTLDAMARLARHQSALVCPMLDARMGEVFGAVYRFRGETREKLVQDQVCPVERLIEGLSGRVHFLGDGAILYRERIEKRMVEATFADRSESIPRASAVAAEALSLLAAGAPSDAAQAAPIYLRKSQAEMNSGITTDALISKREGAGAGPGNAGAE